MQNSFFLHNGKPYVVLDNIPSGASTYMCDTGNLPMQIDDTSAGREPGPIPAIPTFTSCPPIATVPITPIPGAAAAAATTTNPCMEMHQPFPALTSSTSAGVNIILKQRHYPHEVNDGITTSQCPCSICQSFSVSSLPSSSSAPSPAYSVDESMIERVVERVVERLLHYHHEPITLHLDTIEQNNLYQKYYTWVQLALVFINLMIAFLKNLFS